MGRSVELLRKVKYVGSRRMTPRAYWNIMGRLRPVSAVTSDCRTVRECLASGEAVVALFDKLGVLAPDMTTLHIGSGLGRVEFHLRQKVRRCYGIDISSSMVRRAAGLVPYDNVEFLVGDGESLSYWPDGALNLIYSFLVFQHLSRRQFHGYLGAACTKLAPGGHVVFQIMVDEGGSHPDPPRDHPYAIRYYGRDEVDHALARVGLTCVSRTDLAGVPDDGSTHTGDIVFCARRLSV